MILSGGREIGDNGSTYAIKANEWRGDVERGKQNGEGGLRGGTRRATGHVLS